MKRYTFTGTISEYRRLKLSVNGNPAYWATFVNDDGETLTGRTASDAMCAYGFLKQSKLLCRLGRETDR